MSLASVSCTCSASHGYTAQGCWLPTMVTAEANWLVSIISYILSTLLIGHVKAWRHSVELNLIPLRHHFFSNSAEEWMGTPSWEICSKSQIRSEAKAPPQFLVFPSSYLCLLSLGPRPLFHIWKAVQSGVDFPFTFPFWPVLPLNFNYKCEFHKSQLSCHILGQLY